MEPESDAGAKARASLERENRSLTEKLAALTRNLEATKTAGVAAETHARRQAQALATIQHELRTPLQAILTTIDLMIHNDTGPAQQDPLNAIRDTALSLAAVVSHHMAHIRPSDGSKPPLTSFEPEAVVRSIVSLFRALAQAKGLQLLVEIHHTTPENVTGPVDETREILTNLVSNAIKYTKHGSVTISVRRKAGSELEDSALTFEVADTGSGIPRDLQARLFDRYTRGSDVVGGTPGTGLGLSICRQTAQRFGGSLGFASDKDVGSTFWVDVPVSAADTAEGRTDVPSAAHVGGHKILLAEDNRHMRTVLGDLLQSAGFSVTAVADGRSALETAVSDDYDLILLDRHMPRMDGLEAANAIRALETPANAVPIILVTGDDEQVERASDGSGPFNAVLTKPIEWDSLACVIAEALALDEQSHSTASVVPTTTARKQPPKGKTLSSLPGIRTLIDALTAGRAS